MDMDHSNGEEQSPLPIDFNGSLDPGQLPNVTLGNHLLMSSQSELLAPAGSAIGGAGRRSPVKTIKEYNQQVSDLTKENFNLKLRIYHLEEKVERQYGDEQDVFKTNIELNIMVDYLKEELSEKQIYLVKAAEAVSTMTLNHQQAEEAIRKQCLADGQRKMDELKAALDKALQECERSQKQAEDATSKLETMENGQRLAHKTNQNLSENMKAAESHIDLLERKLKEADDMVDGLKTDVSNLHKQLERKNRDMTRLSVCFDDKSLIESTILEPQHLQDRYEDQLEEIERLKKKIVDLEDDLGTKDEKIKGLQKELEEKLKELDDKTLTLAKCQKTMGGIMNRMREMNKNSEDKDKKLKSLESEVSGLRQSLESAAKEKNQLVNDSTMVRETNDYLQHRLDEYKVMAEGCMQSLGKKEGEISGFQEQLQKAMEALTNSGTAVEELQMQLKKERAEFDNKLRNQARLFEECKGPDTNDVSALKQQMAELKKTMADQNVAMLGLQRDMADVERQNKKMKDKEGYLLDEVDGHKRKMSLLEREIHTLRLELERKEMRIGNLQTNTVHVEAPRQTGARLDVNVQLLPGNVMEDMRLLVDNLRQELLTIKVLQNSLQDIVSNRSASGALKPEFDAVHKIYQQLEDDLTKNSQLYKNLLSSVHENSSGRARNNAAPILPLNQNLFVEETEDGPAPPPSSPTSHNASLIEESLTGNDNDGHGLETCELSGNKLNFSDLDHSSMGSRIIGNGLSPHKLVGIDRSLTRVSFDDGSLTDDAKEGHQRHSDNHHPLQRCFDPERQQNGGLTNLPLQSKEVNGIIGCYATSPDHRSNDNVMTNQAPPQAQDNLIDLFSEPLSEDRVNSSPAKVSSENGNDSRSLVKGRESEGLQDSFRNVTRRSNAFSDRFSNVSVRSNRGSTELYPNIMAKNKQHADDSEIRTLRMSTESKRKGGGNDARCTHDPDVVKSTIWTRNREDVLDGTAPSDELSTIRARNIWRENSGMAQGQDQMSPHNQDCGNLNNSGLVSRLLSPQNGQHETRSGGRASMNGHGSQVEQLQLDLNEALRQKEEAQAEIQMLQDKLESTENTVRQLARKMKSFYSSMEQAGINPPLKRRSSSELSIAKSDSPSQRDTTPLRKGSHDSNKDDCEETLCSLSRDNNASIEKGRDDARMGVSSPGLLSPGKSIRRVTGILSPTSTIRSEGEQMSSQTDGPQSLSSVSPLQDFTLDHTDGRQNTSLNNTTHLPYQTLSSNARESSKFSTTLNTESVWDDRNEEFDQEDPTLTSLLVTDYSALHRRLTILSKSFSKYSSGDQSFNDATLNVDKLQARLAHLERIILMQKEEITVYESLLTSMGVPVLTSGHQTGMDNGTSDDSKESLLRQHLVEIRKLRQRLENLDLSNDPDQLLIFHTHTQQRITQQEHTISKLQQTLVEKEETWNRDSMEKEHRMNREKTMLAQRLEVTQEELKNQRITLEEQEKVIINLKENLQLKDQVKREAEEENENLKREKEEISQDLVKREKEFLDMEKMMFKLELAKEEVESQKTMIKSELEENEKQMIKLKCDVEHFKESCKSLRDALRNKEESLHEQVQCLKKMAQEKTGMDEKLAQLRVELEETKAEAENMKMEVEEKRRIEDDFTHLTEEFYELRNILDQKLTLHKQIISQKAELEAEISRLSDENLMEKRENERKIEDLRKNAESELKTKQQELEEEVCDLRTTLDKRRNLESELRMRVNGLESTLRTEEVEKTALKDELDEKTEKVNKRDRQCQFVLDRFGKLEAAYKKQSQILKDKNEAINSMKKQLQLYESTLSRLSEDSEQSTLKELFHELMLTKSQVASLLARIEGNTSQGLPTTEDVYGKTGVASGSSSSSTITSSESTTETTTLHTTNTVNTSNTTTSTTTNEQMVFKSCGRSTDVTTETNVSKSADYSSLSALDAGHSFLWAILKLEQHEKASKQAGECLVSLSGVEARIEDRLKAYKAKSVTESLDYSTLREAGMACHQMRTCLTDVSRIISLAWITELPPVGEPGRVCDSENDELRSELSELKSKYSVLESTVKEQHGKLTVSKQRQRDWEHSVCRQLLRTSQDLEQAKENLDLSQGILKQVNISTNTNKKTDGNVNNAKVGVVESSKKSKSPRPASQHENE